MKTARVQYGGFTLIEIMVVIGILGIVMAMSVPAFYRLRDDESIRQAVADVKEGCHQARAHAILSGQPAELVFTAADGRFFVQSAGQAGSATTEPAASEQGIKSGGMGAAFSATLNEKIGIVMLDVNLQDYMDADVARVRFFPNGTCDEFTIILQAEDRELRKISLEITTGIVNVESNPQNFLR